MSCTTVQYRKMAIYSHHCTVLGLDFVSMALLWYGPYPYSTIFHTAVAVYSTVVNLSTYIQCSSHMTLNIT